MIKVANRSDLWFILLMNLLLVTASGVHELSEEGESYGPIKPINCTFGIPFQLEEGQTLFLENGKICEESHPKEFFSNPKTQRAKEFLNIFQYEN